MKSVVSYPYRGRYGDRFYRGNCSGYLVKELLEHFRPKLVFDPMEGSGTARDVCREMGIRYIGKDIKKGFNLLDESCNKELMESFTQKAPDENSDGNASEEKQVQRPDFIFFHPPYWNIIPYTDRKGDISNAPTYPEFMNNINACIKRLVNILDRGGKLCILIGDKRKHGKYYPMAADLIHEMKKYGEVYLKSILIKVQHNTFSSGIDYKGKFIPIQHEYCLVFRKKWKQEQKTLKEYQEPEQKD